jgi:hypothetical protein
MCPVLRDLVNREKLEGASLNQIGQLASEKQKRAPDPGDCFQDDSLHNVRRITSVQRHVSIMFFSRKAYEN